MLDTALTGMGWIVSDYLIAGRVPGRLGNENATSAPSGTLRTGDGDINIAANTEIQFPAICAVCERPDLLRDERFTTREDRKLHREQLRDELEKTLAARPAGEWEQLLSAAGVPTGRVLTVAEALAQEQVRARGLVHQVPVPGSEPPRSVPILGSGIRLDDTALVPSLPPPRLGQHTADILANLGYTAGDIDAVRSERAI